LARRGTIRSLLDLEEFWNEPLAVLNFIDLAGAGLLGMFDLGR
jgi:hypothetical protein